MHLAIDGGPKAVSNPLPIFRTIEGAEIGNVKAAMLSGPLSGYLGGELTGGLRVEALEYEFAGILGVRHAVAVNSATSGLLAACHAVGISRGSRVLTTPYTMSATAAAPKFLGADVVFGDIEAKTFSLQSVPNPLINKFGSVVITNLFGHPAMLKTWSVYCKHNKIPLIEDNAQSPFAMEYGCYAGTIGDIGVFSLNVHKHLQSGEGGICVTNNSALADRMRLFRNHGELASDSVGLNLRMTEVTAAIALAQLQKRDAIISSRIELAEELTHMAAPYDELFGLPTVREGCKHVYYCWPLLMKDARQRDWFVRAMVAEGVPLRAGYVTPLYNMPAFRAQQCVTTEMVEREIMLFEVCAWDPSAPQREQMRQAFDKVCSYFAVKKDQVESGAFV